MKPEHTKNIKKFIKKYKSVLKLPFMNKFSSEPSAEATGKPIVQILPSLDRIPEEDNTGIAKLAAKYDPNAKVSGGFGKSPVVTILNSGNKKEAALTGEVKGDGPETIVRSLSGQSDSVIPHSYLKPTTSDGRKSSSVTILNSDNKKGKSILGKVKSDDPESIVRTLSGKSDSVIPYSYLKPTDTPRVMSSGNKLISLPKTDVKKLVDLSLTKQITNKITKTKNNEYTLNIPEYGIGKNILSGLMKVASKATPVISKAATKFGSELNKKLSPLTDALKSAKNMGMSLIAEEKRNEPNYDSSSVETTPTPTTAPVAASSEAASSVATAPVATAPVAAKGLISAVSETPKNAPTKIEGGYGSGVGPGTSADELKAQAESTQASLPEQEAPGTAGSRGIAAIGEAVSMAAQVAATVALPGVGGIAMGALKGVGAMASGVGKVAGGLGKAAQAVGAVSGGGGSGGGGAGGGGGSAGEGGGGGMGVPGGAMSSILGAVGVAAVGGGALAAVGGIAAGVGGVAAGIGAAVGGIAGAYGTVAGKLIDAAFGTAKKNETPPVNNIMNDSRSTTTVVNSISNQYDIYRKTADDSFMLPNHRREYG